MSSSVSLTSIKDQFNEAISAAHYFYFAPFQTLSGVKSYPAWFSRLSISLKYVGAGLHSYAIDGEYPVDVTESEKSKYSEVADRIIDLAIDRSVSKTVYSNIVHYRVMGRDAIEHLKRVYGTISKLDIYYNFKNIWGYKVSASGDYQIQLLKFEEDLEFLDYHIPDSADMIVYMLLASINRDDFARVYLDRKTGEFSTKNVIKAFKEFNL